MITVRGVTIPSNELRWRFTRSSGPGGQNVNKRSTQAELSFDLANTPSIGPVRKQRALRRLRRQMHDGVLTVVAHEHRTQARNREAALERLTEILDRALAPPPEARKPTSTPKRAVERRLESKHKRAEVKRLRGRPIED